MPFVPRLQTLLAVLQLARAAEMFCLRHSGFLFVFLLSPRAREEATTSISLPCKITFLLPTTGSRLRSSTCISAPTCSDETRVADPDKQNYCNLHEFTYLTPPTLISSSCLFASHHHWLPTAKTPYSFHVAGYFCLHPEVIPYAARRRDTAFFCDFRQLLGNTDFLPHFQLKAKVSESNNEGQCCSSIF